MVTPPVGEAKDEVFQGSNAVGPRRKKARQPGHAGRILCLRQQLVNRHLFATRDWHWKLWGALFDLPGAPIGPRGVRKRGLVRWHARAAERYATISRMSDEAKSTTEKKEPSLSHAEHEPQPAHGHAAASGPMIHRVCIQCNNMFSVPAGDYATKQCPVCHKG